MSKKKLTPPTGLISDVVIKLPAEDVEKSSGLSLDIGSTIGKIIYRSNKEYKDGKPINEQGDNKMGQAHFAMFPRDDISGMVKYVKENCDLKANSKGVVKVNSSGVGGATFRREIESELDCKIDVQPEFDCFCKAFLALEKAIPIEELVLPIDPALKAELDTMEKQLMELEAQAADMQEATMAAKVETDIKDEDRSRILVMAGSGTGIMELKADGTFGILAGLYTAGRFMYGLASFLTGINDFSKILEMAKKGDGRTSDVWSSDLMPKEKLAGQDDNIYSMGEDMDMNMFPFGKGVHKTLDEVKKEDLAFSVLNCTATLHAQCISDNVRAVSAKEVFFVGNTFNSDIMRELVLRKKTELGAFLQGQKHEYKFLANGGMYGAVGAFLKPPTEE